MRQYIIFLRGVMPTGRNKVPMAPLKEVLVAAGLTDVRTYIQSGNILARSALTASGVERLVHEQIKRHFGGDIAVIARTPKQLRRTVSDNLFKGVDPTQLYFVIFAGRPNPDAVQKVAQLRFPLNRFVIMDEVAYLHCPNGYSQSKVNNNFLEKQLGVAATLRNHNTLRKVVELSGLE